MNQKKVFQLILAMFVIVIMLLPLVVPFNSLMTRLVEDNSAYLWIQQTVVPIETRMVGLLVKPWGVDVKVGRDLLLVNGRYARVTWNCLGWQSALLFIITLIFGLRKSQYTRISKIETIVIGLSSLYLINLLRMAFTVLLLAFARPIFKIVFHDYFSAIVTITFLLFFWWFAYEFILEERRESHLDTSLKPL